MYKLKSKSVKKDSIRQEKEVASYYLYEKQIEKLKEESNGEPSEFLRDLLTQYFSKGDSLE